MSVVNLSKNKSHGTVGGYTNIEAILFTNLLYPHTTHSYAQALFEILGIAGGMP